MGWRARVSIEIVLYTGIKLRELMDLEVHDLRVDLFEEPQLAIRARRPRLARTFTLPRAWTEIWYGYVAVLKPTDNVFTYTEQALCNILCEVGDCAGIQLHFEMLRWTYIVRSVNENVSSETLRERLALTEEGLAHIRDKLESTELALA